MFSRMSTRSVLVVSLAACAFACGSSDASPVAEPEPAPPAAAPVAPPAAPAAPPPGPACTARGVDVVLYTEDGWNELADGLAKNPTACASYYVSIPSLANDKTKPRGPKEPANMRARGAGFHPMAEFHWGGWSQVTTMSWYDKGVEFRKRMTAAGYDVTAGDVWEINELPSTVRTTAETRANVREAIKGLYDGPPGSPKVQGAVFVIGLGSATTNLGPYKTNLGDWLADDAFWADVTPRTKWWGQETYVAPAQVCVEGAATSAWSAHIQDYVEHVELLADAAPAGSAPKGFLKEAYTPLANAAFESPAYDTETMTLAEMQSFVSMQVFAAKSWSAQHAKDRARDAIGFGWTYKRDVVTPADESALADRLASAIAAAWAPAGGEAADVCNPGKQAPTLCACKVAGAAFNDAWKTFQKYGN